MSNFIGDILDAIKAARAAGPPPDTLLCNPKTALQVWGPHMSEEDFVALERGDPVRVMVGGRHAGTLQMHSRTE